MKGKIKVLYIANVPMPNERANGVQIAHTCAGLVEAGADLTLITRYASGSTLSVASYFNIQETFTHTRLFTIDIPGLPFRYFIRNFSFFFFVQMYILWKRFVSILSREKLVVYVRGETVLALLPLTYLVPVFFETHQIRNYEWLYRIALRRVCGIVVITDRLKKKFVEEYGIDADKILMVRDAVDLHLFRSATPNKSLWVTHGIDVEKKIALYAGTLASEKGVDTLAEASNFVRGGLQVVFLGGTHEQVVAFKKKYGHMRNVFILGRVEYTEVPKYVMSADVLILPDSALHTYSNLYTSPMKLFEYMATGRPIVASNVPSLREVLDEDTAILFTPDDPTSLATSIDVALTDAVRSKRLAVKAQEIVTDFTWEKRTKAIVAHILALSN